MTATTAGAGQPASFSKMSAVMLATANVEPTDRSIPPETTTIVMPRQTSENSASSRSVDSAFAVVANVGTVTEKNTISAPSRPSGMAGSIQRFSRSSATNCWSENR